MLEEKACQFPSAFLKDELGWEVKYIPEALVGPYHRERVLNR